ncbi:MAG TPA: type II toxin-antitoxin system RelE/ParE family toxin [Cytophagaceae bacterium]|jgi:phage-related protein|nr:type II toxin-antitoxin system RelE/ParE family toxin [Cytophagaceae bacterium]
MSKEFLRQVTYYKHYYLDFFNKQTKEVKKKFNWTLGLISELERIPTKYFKHIEGSDSLYEIRIEAGSNIFRVFCFFDEGRLIILLNGFQKKSDKTPKNEIELANKLKTQYYEEK